MDWKLLWRRMRLLLWKNAVMRRRNLYLTCTEIVLAPVIGLFIYLLCVYAPDSHYPSSAPENLAIKTIDETSTFGSNILNPNVSRLPILPLLHTTKGINPCDWITTLQEQGGNHSVGFTPNSREARQIVEQVIEAVESWSYNCSHGNHLPAFQSGSLKADGFDSVQDMKMAHLQREITFRMNGDAVRKISVGIEFKGICKRSYAMSYKIWHRKEKAVDEKTERQDMIVNYGSKWKKQIRTASRFSFSRKEEQKRAGFQIILDQILVRFFLSQRSLDMNQTLDFTQNMDISLEPFSQNSSHGNPLKTPRIELLRATKLLSFTLPVYTVILISVVVGVVNEKKSQLKSLLILMGIPRWMHTLCWFVDGMVIGCSSAAFHVLLYKIRLGDLGFKDASAPFPHSDWGPLYLILVVYLIHGLSLSLFLSSFFNTAHIAVVAMFVVLFSVSHAVVLNLAHLSSFQRSLVVMIFPNVGASLLTILAFDLELKGVGLQWSNLCDPFEMVDSMTLLQFMGLQGGMSVAYIILAQYMENILLQDSYGVAKPFYYPLLLSTWVSFPQKDANKNVVFNKSCAQGSKVKEKQVTCNEFEVEPTGIKTGVEILGLTKEFNRGQHGKKKRVVDDFHLNLFQGQITVLLGHNGSGKTTLISMLTGLTKPTSGTAVVNRYDLNMEMKEMYKTLGFCPQKNVLCKELSVVENLLFFGQLKGLNRNQVHQEIQGLIKTLALQEKTNTPAKYLSGGQKRKLQLAISLLSDSKVVYLDEPTSGMDPETRRLVWDCLLEIRKKRTVLLTTHFMEEAEVCGDRIAIMEHGQLKYCGTTFFLKRLFGTGYTLHLNLHKTGGLKMEEEKKHLTMVREEILSKVQHFIKDARVKPRFVHNDTVMDIILPMIATNNNNRSQSEGIEHLIVCSKIPLLLRDLTDSQKNLKIKKLALFVTTMDDVFSSAIGENDLQTNVPENGHSLNGLTNALNSDNSKHCGAISFKERLAADNITVSVSSLKLTLRQIYALLKRRLEYSWNYKALMAAQLIVNCSVTVFSAMLVKNKTDELWFRKEGEEKDPYNTEGLSNTDVKLQGESFKGFYSPFVQGSAQLVSNRVANSILTQFHRMTKDFSKGLSMTMMPSAAFHSLDDYDVIKLIEKTSLDSPAKFLDAAFVFLFGLVAVHSSFLIVPLQEKHTRVKHLEIMTGLSPLVYWTSLFIWDALFCILLSFVNITIMIVMEGDLSITKNGGFGALILTMNVIYFTGIAFAYLLTCFFTSPAFGVFAFNVISTSAGVLVVGSLMSEAFVNLTRPMSYLVQYSFKLLAPVSFIPCIGDFYPTAIINSRCNFVPDFIKNMTCDYISQHQRQQNQYQKERIFHHCCGNTEIQTRPFLEWDIKNSSVVTNLKSFDGFGGFQGLGQELLIVFTVGLLYLILVLAIDYKMPEQLYNLVWSDASQGNQNHTYTDIQNTSKSLANLDQDVQDEQERVIKQAQTTCGQQDAFLCVDLSKRFGSFQAVSNLSFGVHPGECFGLLGVNGAGKSTTFSMLTGSLKPSFGNAFIKDKNEISKNYSLLESEQGYLKNIGYCPQFDALLPMLTGRQHLELFARLRGCSSQETRLQVQRWLHNLGLEECADYHCGNYSGGMQRRLNTAMSMIANPSMILLDEPTSGVDPVSRRQFWRAVASLKDSGQSVILTSHCMEECENLCSRLAIMVGGQIQCLGSPNSLREKCPQGYVLKIQLRSESESQVQNQVSKSTESDADTDKLDKLETLISEIINKFHPCTLQEFHQSRIQFSLANKEISLADAFNIMEEIFTQYSNEIQEYCLGETTLEQVFLAVATSGGFESRETAQSNL